MSVRALLASALLAAGSMAQLTGSVGPLTTSAQKAAVKVCNILDYGGVASVDTDNGAAITAAWSACASGGQVYIPAGDYGLATWVSLKHGTGVSINIEGTIHRTGTGGGNMIFIQLSTDLEIYSATSTGAIQALGYEFHKNGEYGARILRLYKTSNFSIHDIALVDSPQFHLTLDTCTSGEVYNTVIHGGYEGGLDGIDVSGSNIWIHDVEVSNKDECVTVKNPSSNLLIESVHCNWSGGCGMGSLPTGTNIHDIEYRNIYTHHSNNMYMIKSNGGDGTVYNLALNNFIGHTNAYMLLMDTAWSKQAVGSGNGVVYHDISVNEWHGTAQNGVQRAPVRLLCPALAPCYDVNITNFSVSSEAASKELYICQNAYGEGACLKELEAGATSATASYAATTHPRTVASPAFATMANELASGFDISSPIPIPTIPASFFPGIAPKPSAFGSWSGRWNTGFKGKKAE
ncbi:rhamnogalacturonase a precursor [Grosmannia clavigera kw1407]|uniref:Rhamnogalacturonase a n=1 Tax=Grosmannia clavigera (strain kw1407 / UAMH 11150) TaxID=655863 RepID=F0XH57_GROCL|nr:rhamnogalacturonase a precursor [Grosmannia clavigera kw1407]EFX03047.1 rhamnogalacturonase a precursor [Grosmannia clavigera kw1407]